MDTTDNNQSAPPDAGAIEHPSSNIPISEEQQDPSSTHPAPPQARQDPPQEITTNASQSFTNNGPVEESAVEPMDVSAPHHNLEQDKTDEESHQADMEIDKDTLDVLAALDDHDISSPPAAAPSPMKVDAAALEAHTAGAPAPPSASAADAEVKPSPSQEHTNEPPTKPPQTNLEQLYSPYLLPTDTSLSSARSRLRHALEQTRLLRQAFTTQVYERYNVTLQPLPDEAAYVAHLDKLCVDPHASLAMLKSVEVEKKKERDRIKAEEGESDPLASFGGDGLHLVILPEEQAVPVKKVVISTASAAAAEGLLDRVRRVRGLPVGEEDRKRREPETTSRRVDRSLNSSPSLSVDSNIPQQPPPSRKSGYSTMLTLTPSGETLNKNSKRYSASQSALLSKGVGLTEMKRDPRLSTLARHQRVIPKEFYETALPPLLGGRQVGRMEVRRVAARRVLRSVVREILDGDDEDEGVANSLDGKGDGDKGGGGGDKDGGGGSSELGLYGRINSLSEKHRENQSSNQDKSNDGGGGASGEIRTVDLAIDPIVAYSVMNAVGLVDVKSEEANVEKPTEGVKESENPIAKTLGLSKLMNLGPVSDFVKSFSPKGKRKQAEDDGLKAKKAKVDTAVSQCAPLHIRGGGDDEEEKDTPTHPSNHESAASAPSSNNLTPTMQNQLFQQQSLYNLNPSLGSMQSSLDPYQSAALAHQLGLSMGGLPSYPMNTPMNAQTADLSEFFLRRQLADHSLLPGQLNYSIRDQQDAVTAMLLREQQNVAAAAAAVQYQAALSSLASQQSQYAAYHAGSIHSPNQASVQSHMNHPTGAGTSKAEAIDVDPVQPSQRKRSKSLEESKIASSPKRVKKVNKAKGKASPVSRPSSAPVQPPKIALPKPVDPKKDPPLVPNVSESALAKMDPPINPKVAAKDPQVALETAGAKVPPVAPVTDATKDPSGALKVAAKDPPAVLKSATANPPISTAPVIPKVTAEKNIPKPSIATTLKQAPHLHFTPPEPPKGLRPELAQLVLDAKFHEAFTAVGQKPCLAADLLVEFLLSLARAIPIPHDIIIEILVKKLAKFSSLKDFVGDGSFASSAREVIVATIAVRLWTQHESHYKQSYLNPDDSNARRTSNVVIGFAVDKGLHAISAYCKSTSSGTSNVSKGEIASVVNKSLVKKVVINKQVDASLPMMDDMLGLLDSLRMEALKAKVQERVLLATLVSRHGKMSEAFSNAYVSSIIRAGEALGHEDVCEIAQDEKCRASTMLPYDFFHDHTGLWEEPCRPPQGVHPNTTGKELTRRAHATAVIQKSMKKLQDCLGLQGGISDGGPYFSSKSATGSSAPSPSGTPTVTQAVLVRTSSSNLKRKGSQTWDTTVMPGTGISGVPDSIFNPEHYIEPMKWDNRDTSNTPYGRHQVGLRPSIYSVGGSLSESKWRGLKQFSPALQNRSTHEVKWEDVADMFLHGGSTRRIVLDLGGDSGTKKKTIIAPFVRSFDIKSLNVDASGDEGEYSEEDISDETVLRRHQEILDGMSKKITAITEKKQQQTQPRGRKKQI